MAESLLALDAGKIIALVRLCHFAINFVNLKSQLNSTLQKQVLHTNLNWSRDRC